MTKKLNFIRPDMDVHRDRLIIPAEFWGEMLSNKEFHKICETSVINGKPLRRLWKMLKRTDPLPDGLYITLRAEDVLRAFPPKLPKDLP